VFEAFATLNLCRIDPVWIVDNVLDPMKSLRLHFKEDPRSGNRLYYINSYSGGEIPIYKAPELFE
jgi:hypothetical protein